MADEVDVGNDFAQASIDASRAMATENNHAGRCSSYVPGQLTGPKLSTEKNAHYLARLGDQYCANEECGEEIPLGRREHCYRLCVDCQSKFEHRKRGL